MLTATNLMLAAGLVLLSYTTGPVGLLSAWLILGIGMGFDLYEAAFATVAGLYGREARNAITGITLFADFAGTVGWPLSAGLIDAFGWRGALLGWAALHMLLGLPLNRLLVPRSPPSATATPEAAPSFRSLSVTTLSVLVPWPVESCQFNPAAPIPPAVAAAVLVVRRSAALFLPRPRSPPS